ncbi:class I SAM-dependent methyltransferase [Haloferax mediterranei ATCC 33500]|uniref:Class I SAM-dependent methyltransferase n=1 Tax=Haloferax mediterranei (strain ATCC 33500 / DSM 1411 / JCM 8866 / NBRC 14739 / NCIMB 2177 / R-4) TaxID=523841 RepID=I3R4D3_HALMT|nr:methyltransferase [Haloferax mediterranei]AFK19093.2 tyrA operon protein [Haloferax mediterranei ATCC 33500]AHZ21547.1 methyltransferase type 12 [Haloferax mediterranei ATCC 33500]EMA04008.1 tyrA operon protein [Haloferax mediterranei ATCC 33500]MDX5989185.1 methyltransferase [Haloferax mediterranei ATCC 33500]QCQ75566.1 class I SAM-dependent methyltransferase [Haloferax mediterranei ATCC 33500]
MIDRDAVRDNAKYLRNVRPIDPDEIADYIEGAPHPAVVKQTLREEASDLGLFERDDGTFVPVSDDPVPFQNWSPTAFPDDYSFALEDMLIERYGANWHVGDSGDRLRQRVRQLKEDYYRGNPVEYDEDAALGYAIYHLPDYYAAVGYVLSDLAERNLLSRTLRILDVGAGTGGPALGLHDYLPDDSVVDYHALEPSASADVLERMLGEARRNFRTTVHRETAEAFDPEGEYDIVLFGSVLSELDDPAAVVRKYLDALADDGAIVAIAPADRNTSIGLREIEREVAPANGDVTVYSPTLRLWDGYAPSDRGWSFDVKSDLDVPGFQRRLDEGRDSDEDEGTFINVDVQYSYSILRTDGERRLDVRGNPSRFAKMAEMERHVTNRIDLLAVKLSHDLSEGNNQVFKIGDGSEGVDHYAVRTHPTVLNADVADADYGDVLVFENILALWNDDEEAYNLVVDDETLVDRVA